MTDVVFGPGNPNSPCPKCGGLNQFHFDFCSCKQNEIVGKIEFSNINPPFTVTEYIAMPSRREKICGLLKQVWELYPDLRLGQLLIVVSALHNCTNDDLFYCEDHTLQAWLEQIIRNGKL